ncbi:thioesterase superfamily protein [Lachnoclostridium phytofermentans ISDg]|uniref:Thioesterase superfamily protein n=2 Tax=Lachnoclostridium phytofermentans TaxID=66219 RepID=A9KKV6_LACP7|nr:thioesterase superfamily protein [Lachnoclostridium phytofermentans ISDg]
MEKFMNQEEIQKRVSESLTEKTYIVMQAHINGSGRLFGGQLLAWIDELAGIVGMRHSGGNVITASIDNLQFKHGAHLNDIVVLVGRVTYVGNSSMEVRIDTYVENKKGTRHPINRAYFVMVALDENEQPKKVPRLKIETVEQQAEWDAAIKRHTLRKQRKAEGY